MNFGNTTKTLLSGALALVLIFSPVTVGAQSGGGALPFQVRDIRVEGLQRIPVERVYAELPIQPGDTVNRNDVVQAVKRLFATGDYEDVQLGRDGDELVVVVAER
ncbi:MAG TPA: outer membrane protein assembly factor BamA, partial [Alcanivorax sp.]|nr:outer membrane protein assembly factor BamA [Alcanivorax sp.]HCQ36025.1 outer membrane protein assembly factor BamA [Alcanivorax sp.]